MSAIRIDISQADMKNVREMCYGINNAVPKVIADSVNRTLPGVRTDASTLIREVITVKKKDVDATMKITKANISNMNADFNCTGKPLPLIAFKYREKATGTAIKIKVKSGEYKLFPESFIAVMKSGHKGIFTRLWHEAAGARLRKKKMKYGGFPKAYRFPMKELFGVRVSDVMSNKEIIDGTCVKAAVRLHDAINHMLDFELSKHK